MAKNIYKKQKLILEPNSVHPAIQFTMEVNETELPFLDITIKEDDEKVWTIIYFGPPYICMQVPSFIIQSSTVL